MTQRFTIDGSPELEAALERLCSEVCHRVLGVIPERRLEALVLGGGYGRGHGGVLRTSEGDRPYNDLEFYIFVRGRRLSNQRRYAAGLQLIEQDISRKAGLHVEFKLESRRHLEGTPITMFSYDLVRGSRIVRGDSDLFRGCEHHLSAPVIPFSEATRLLFNRCSGLLLCRERLAANDFTEADADFVYRNTCKVWLALGDAVLTAENGYHWDCRQRHRRLCAVRNARAEPPWLDEVVSLHEKAVDFKLHPVQSRASRAELRPLHNHATGLAFKIWIWLEGRRLQVPFEAARDYCLHPVRKCPEDSAVRNYLLNCKSIGSRAVFDPRSTRYPRERLFNSLPLLLWNGFQFGPDETRHLQEQLGTTASDWDGLVGAYKKIWAHYG